MVRHHPQWLMAREHRAQGQARHAPRDPGALHLPQRRPQQRPQHGRYRRRRRSTTSAATRSSSGRYIFGAEPLRVVALIDRDPKFGTDRTTSALVDFGEGRHLTFTTSTQATPYQRVHILGTKARLEVEIPFNAPQGGAMKLYLDNGTKFAGAAAQAPSSLPKADQYQLQGEAFSRAVRGKEKLELRRRGRHPAGARHRRALPLGEVRQLGEAVGQ